MAAPIETGDVNKFVMYTMIERAYRDALANAREVWEESDGEGGGGDAMMDKFISTAVARSATGYTPPQTGFGA